MLGTYPEATGELRVTRTEGPLESARYEWATVPTYGRTEVGDVFRIGMPFLQDFCGVRGDPMPGQVVTLGPYRLRLITGEDWNYMAVYAMHDGWKARAYALWYRAAKPLRRTYHRLILTAAVWGLARFQQYVEPSWRDLHIVRRWRKGRD
jgi:hypothetical protein